MYEVDPGMGVAERLGGTHLRAAEDLLEEAPYGRPDEDDIHLAVLFVDEFGVHAEVVA